MDKKSQKNRLRNCFAIFFSYRPGEAGYPWTSIINDIASLRNWMGLYRMFITAARLGQKIIGNYRNIIRNDRKL